MILKRAGLLVIAVICVSVFHALPARAGVTPEELESMKPVTGPDGRIVFDLGSREERAGFIIVRLKGEPYRRGFQQGRLLRKEIREAIRDTDTEVKNFVEQYTGVETNVSMVNVLKQTAYNQVIKKMLPSVPDEYLEEMKGVAAGAGADYKDILYLNAGYDALENAMNMACTAFAAAPAATTDGILLHARNLDWESAEMIAKQNIIFLIEPSDGLPFVSVAPSPFVCLATGMNVEGVSATVNVSLSNESTVDGEPTFLMLRRVVQYSKSLDEAVETIRGAKRTVGSNFMLSGGASGVSVLLECSSGACAERRFDDRGVLWASNNYASPEMQSRQRYMTRYGNSNTGNRFRRAGALMTAAAGSLDVNALIGIMRDRYNWETGAVDSFCPQSLCNYKTAQSVIFAPGKLWMWIAQPWPTPACDGEYTGFDIAAEFGAAPTLEMLSIAENTHRDTDDYKAFTHYQKAKKLLLNRDKEAALTELDASLALATQSASLLHRAGVILGAHYGDYARSAALLEQSADIAAQLAAPDFPFETVFYFIGKARLALGDYDSAIKALESVFSHGPLDTDRKAWTHVRIGQSLDALGRRDDALAAYNAAAALDDKKSKKAAEFYLEHPFNPAEHKLETAAEQTYISNNY